MGKKICFIFLTFVLALSLSALAQETTGGIQGTVKDPQGAAALARPGNVVQYFAGFLRRHSDQFLPVGRRHFIRMPMG